MRYTSCICPFFCLFSRTRAAALTKTLNASRQFTTLNLLRRVIGFTNVSHRRTPPHMHGQGLDLTMSEAGLLNSKWYRTVLYETYKYIRAYKPMIQIESDREC